MQLILRREPVMVRRVEYLPVALGVLSKPLGETALAYWLWRTILAQVLSSTVCKDERAVLRKLATFNQQNHVFSLDAVFTVFAFA